MTSSDRTLSRAGGRGPSAGPAAGRDHGPWSSQGTESGIRRRRVGVADRVEHEGRVRGRTADRQLVEHRTGRVAVAAVDPDPQVVRVVGRGHDGQRDREARPETCRSCIRGASPRSRRWPAARRRRCAGPARRSRPCPGAGTGQAKREAHGRRRQRGRQRRVEVELEVAVARERGRPGAGRGRPPVARQGEGTRPVDGRSAAGRVSDMECGGGPDAREDPARRDRCVRRGVVGEPSERADGRTDRRRRRRPAGARPVLGGCAGA